METSDGFMQEASPRLEHEAHIHSESSDISQALSPQNIEDHQRCGGSANVKVKNGTTGYQRQFKTYDDHKAFDDRMKAFFGPFSPPDFPSYSKLSMPMRSIIIDSICASRAFFVAATPIRQSPLEMETSLPS
jgi:hypothetical protein